jgi:hypothetical protein
MALQFGKDIALLGQGAAATATGTTLSSTPAFNITGYDGLVALTHVAVTSTGNGLVWTVSTASGGTFSDVAGSWATCHLTEVMSEIHRPAGGPWFKANLRQPTSGRHGEIYVFGVNPAVRPTTGNTSLLSYHYANSPGTGTATSS